MSQSLKEGSVGVRCADCRYLAVLENNRQIQPDPPYRVSGGSARGPVGAPMCLKEQGPLTSEFERAEGSHSERVISVLWKARTCSAYAPTLAASD
jgi:hypothetical protein